NKETRNPSNVVVFVSSINQLDAVAETVAALSDRGLTISLVTTNASLCNRHPSCKLMTYPITLLAAPILFRIFYSRAFHACVSECYERRAAAISFYKAVHG